MACVASAFWAGSSFCHRSSSSRTVIARSPTRAATSVGAGEEGCCAGADEHARKVAATDRRRARVMSRIIRLLVGTGRRRPLLRDFLAGTHLELAESRIRGHAAHLVGGAP